MKKLTTFEQLGISEFLQKALDKLAISKPTPIQAEAIPKILAGNHVVGKSNTGSGKTLAYLLPLLTKLDPNNKELQAIILAPTHELAMQIFRVMEQLIVETDFHIDVFIGSANIKRQLEKLKKQKPQMIVGTPGRIMELAQQKKLKIHQAKMIVVDEADRMLMEKETRQAFIDISKRIEKEANYHFFSATIPENLLADIEVIIRSTVTFVSIDQKIETEKVEHQFLKCEDRDRIDVVRRLIHSLNIKRGIVFINYLDKVVETTTKLQYKGIKVAALSSDSNKQERAKVLQQLQSSEIEVIVASDIAARGLDVEDVTHIINLHPPVDENSYVHRAGRTGRMGKKGFVITLVTPKEMFIIDKFQKKLGIKITEKELAYGKLNSKKTMQKK